MTNFTFIIIGSYSIAVAAIIGLIRFTRIHRAYHPFIFITVASLINEVISHILIHYKKSNAITINLLGLADALLWLWQFRRWNGINKHSSQFHAVAILMISIWIFENLILGKLFTFSSVYAIVFSFAVVFFSINQVNRQIVEEKGNLFTNAKFLICSGTILFFTYRILVECFYLLDMQKSDRFLANVFSILAFVNLIVNLLFALATLWIPARQKFSLPYY